MHVRGIPSASPDDYVNQTKTGFDKVSVACEAEAALHRHMDAMTKRTEGRGEGREEKKGSTAILS